MKDLQKPSQSDGGCRFGVWDKDTKEMSPCGEETFLHIKEDSYCVDHFVDAIMQVQVADPEWRMAPELAKALIAKKEHLM